MFASVHGRLWKATSISSRFACSIWHGTAISESRRKKGNTFVSATHANASSKCLPAVLPNRLIAADQRKPRSGNEWGSEHDIRDLSRDVLRGGDCHYRGCDLPRLPQASETYNGVD